MTDMRIVELGDCSMVIMKDSEDPPLMSVGDIYRKATTYNLSIVVDKEQFTVGYIRSTEFICTAGRLILFFKKNIPPRFKLHDKVVLWCLQEDTIITFNNNNNK